MAQAPSAGRRHVCCGGAALSARVEVSEGVVGDFMLVEMQPWEGREGHQSLAPPRLEEWAGGGLLARLATSALMDPALCLWLCRAVKGAVRMVCDSRRCGRGRMPGRRNGSGRLASRKQKACRRLLQCGQQHA